ncbi:MAG: tryptophan synthase alpha chain [Lysobacteraceae bacterium]|nr:MAG: tryptophan synthase alpha chain [Xanthomonadaceae bacterium]
MNRIQQCFARLASTGRKGLIPFVTCGDPSLEATVPVLHALVDAGADLIELGVPFSDPQADGPVIQRSSERALARGVGLRRVLDCCRAFRERDTQTPLVLMGYLNPLEIFGLEAFAAAAAEAGVDGVLVVDCPPEEMGELEAALRQASLVPILLASPTTDADRLALIGRRAEGYLYYVSFAGVTGASALDADEVGRRVMALRAHCRVPVAVGFGVKDGASARAVAAHADAVVIGSALVERLAGCEEVAEAVDAARAFLAPVRAALDGANG